MKKLCSLLLVLLFATVAFAQNKSRIVGTASTPDGAVIPGVKVTIVSDAIIAGTMTTNTGERGVFRFTLLPIGTYDIKFEKEGYKTVEQKGIALGFDATVTVNQVLQPGEFEETLLITGEVPLIDKTSSGISSKLDADLLQNVPNTRNIWEIPNLVAGFTDNSAFGAIETSGQAYNTDGINTSNPEWGTASQTINYEAVEQLDVSMFGAPAEYGSFTGASLNVVTKSGGNVMHGEFNFFLRNADWVSDNTGDYHEYGITLPQARNLIAPNFAIGGPLKTNKAWAFFNLNYQRYATDRQLIDKVITQSEVPFQAFAKLSAYWQERNISTFSWIYHKNKVSHELYMYTWLQNIENTLAKLETGNNTFLLQNSFVANDDLIMEGRYAGWRGNDDLLPFVDDYEGKAMKHDLAFDTMMPDSVNNAFIFHDLSRDNLLFTTQYFNDDWKGSHSFKFGLEYERSRSTMLTFVGTTQQYVAGISSFMVTGGTMDADTIIKRWAAFLQDSWSVNDRLTFNLGFRVDFTGEYAGKPENCSVGTDAIAKLTDPAFRLGFAYDLFGDGKTVLRGFFGRYYQKTVTGVFANMTAKIDPLEFYMGRAVMGPDAPEWTLAYAMPIISLFDTDPDLKNTYTQGFLLGLERELWRNTNASVNFIYKRDYDFIGMLVPGTIYEEKHGEFTNEHGSYSGPYYVKIAEGLVPYITNIHKGGNVLEEPFRKYIGLSFEFTKRMSNNWSLGANYTFSRNSGNFTQHRNAVRNTDGHDNPMRYYNSKGRAFMERPHVFKLFGTFIAPYDIFISPVVAFSSGFPYAKQVFFPPDVNVRIKPVDGRDRYPKRFNIDFRIEKAFQLSERYRLGIVMDVFNLLNEDAVTRYAGNVINFPNYLQPIEIVPARYLQLGLRLTF